MLNNLALVQIQLGAPKKALNNAQQGLKLIRDVFGNDTFIGDGSPPPLPPGMEWTPAEAEFLQEADAVDRANSFQTRYENETQLLDTIGVAYSKLGQTDQALTTLQEALAVAQQLKDRPSVARILTHMGEVLSQQNQDDQALSTCDTAQGKIRSDGVIGLSRSFIAAGTPSIIVTLWKVPDDSTAFLMSEFYRQLAATGDKAVALRQAMLATLEEFPDPQNWAAPVLIGEAQ